MHLGFYISYTKYLVPSKPTGETIANNLKNIIIRLGFHV